MYNVSVSKINPETLAYTAGIIDGDGCISIRWVKQPSNHPGKPYVSLRIQVGMVTPLIPLWLQDTFGGTLNIGKRSPPCRNVYMWALSCQHAATFLKSILPYLKEKVPQASLGIELQELKLRSNRNGAYQIQRQIEIFNENRKLNTVGVPLLNEGA